MLDLKSINYIQIHAKERKRKIDAKIRISIENN